MALNQCPNCGAEPEKKWGLDIYQCTNKDCKANKYCVHCSGGIAFGRGWFGGPDLECPVCGIVGQKIAKIPGTDYQR